MNYRNSKLMAYAKEAPHCMYCKAANQGQVVASHSNALKHGKGMGIKAHDIPAYVCNECHFDIDFGQFSREQKRLIWADAMFESMLWLLQTGRLVLA